MVEVTGECVYCGQTHMVRVPEGAEEGEINKAATMICDCDDAKAEQDIETNINITESRIKEEWSKAPAVQKLMLAAVSDIAHGTTDKLVVNQGRTKYTLSRTSKGTLKTEKETKIKEVKES